MRACVRACPDRIEILVAFVFMRERQKKAEEYSSVDVCPWKGNTHGEEYLEVQGERSATEAVTVATTWKTKKLTKQVL